MGHLGERLLRVTLDAEGRPLAALVGGQGILWGTDGRFAWGGHLGPQGWQALVLEGTRAHRLPLPAEGYAYGGLYRAGVLFLVGRVASPGGLTPSSSASKTATPRATKAASRGTTTSASWASGERWGAWRWKGTRRA